GGVFGDGLGSPTAPALSPAARTGPCFHGGGGGPPPPPPPCLRTRSPPSAPPRGCAPRRGCTQPPAGGPGPAAAPRPAGRARAGGDLFGALGVRPEVGRAFTPGEMAAGTPVVVLSHDLWVQRFAADPAVAGRTVRIDGAPSRVIGVMPAGRGYPAGAELWRP